MSILNELRPWYTINIYDYENVNLLHTIENEAITLKIKNSLTSNVGTFSFSLPTTKDGFDFEYNDIKPYYFAVIDLCWPTELHKIKSFTGQIFNINTVASPDTGYERTFKGRDYAHILQRAHSDYYKWEEVAANTVAEDIADIIGYGKSRIEADATTVTVIVDVDKHETYFNIMRAISDYWFDAGTQIKKDFFVDENANLVYASRPLRTVGVEAITLADMSAYNLFRDIQAVKNWIWVHGARELAYPTDRDQLTELLVPDGNELDTVFATWSVQGGGSTISKDADEDVGDWAVKTAGGAATGLILTFDGGHELNGNYYPMLVFRCKADDTLISIYLEDTGGEVVYATVDLPELMYYLFHIPIGLKNADHWTPSVFNVNPFDWEDISIINWAGDAAAGRDLWIDGFFINNRAFYAQATDADSYGLYGYAMMVHEDEMLHSQSDCTKRVEALLFQRKDAPYRLDFQVPGNPNLLLGDRIPISLPEGSSDWDVLSVEDVLSGKPLGWRTNVTTLNSGDTRLVAPISYREYLVREKVEGSEVSKGRLIIR